MTEKGGVKHNATVAPVNVPRAQPRRTAFQADRITIRLPPSGIASGAAFIARVLEILFGRWDQDRDEVKEWPVPSHKGGYGYGRPLSRWRIDFDPYAVCEDDDTKKGAPP